VTTRGPGARRRGLPGMPLLSRWGLVLGVAILFAVVILGGTLFGDDANRVNAIADPLAELPAFSAGTPPADAPEAHAGFAEWAQGRAFDDWKRAFNTAGRAWQDPDPAPAAIFTEPGAQDARAAIVLGAGAQAALYVQGVLGIPGRIELARRDKPELQRALGDAQTQFLACLAGAWGRTLMSPARLAAAAPAPEAKSVRLGAEVGDPEVCDTFSTDDGS